MADKVDQLEKRIARLEAAVFNVKKSLPLKGEEFKGPSGGIKLLIKKGFFNSRKNLGDVRKKLEEINFVYNAQSVDNALTRLAISSGPLVVLKDRGKKVYCVRK